MKRNIEGITEKVDLLQHRGEAQIFEFMDAENKIDPMIKFFFHHKETDPQLADDSLKCRALEYMKDWRASTTLEGWKQIEKFWLELWKSREEFEREIMDEMKGY